MNKETNLQPKTPYIEKKDAWSSHSIIHDWLNTFPPGTKVLDIGTATGMLGKRWSRSGFFLKGLEPVRTWAEEAKPYYDEFLCLTVEQAPKEFLSNQDVIVFADILEHTVNPEQILQHLVSLQKPETQFFISVPNIANIWIRFNLLFGKFNYTDNGILDKTHLRFYTKSSFLALLCLNGLQPIEIQYTPIPLNLVSSFFQKNKLGRIILGTLAILTRLLPGLLAYQFVARCIQKSMEVT